MRPRVLRPLLAEADPDLRSNWLDDTYNSQYRTTSFHYVHGHLGGVSLHVDPSGNVVKEPDQDPSHHVLVVGAALCCSLLVAASLSMGFAEPGELVSSRTVLEHLQRKVLKQVKKGGQS